MKSEFTSQLYLFLHHHLLPQFKVNYTEHEMRTIHSAHITGQIPNQKGWQQDMYWNSVQ